MQSCQLTMIFVSICNQYWAIHPANKAVRCAKCFLVGQVIYMSHLGKHCRTGLSTNLNIQVMMNVYEYTAENVYVSAGHTSLSKATNILLVDITPHIECADSGSLHFKHSSIVALNGYTPFHPDVDIESRMLLDTDATSRTADLSIESTSDELFIVERVLQKCFHPQRQHNEVLVKWRGCADAENTWKLPSNIPDTRVQLAATASHEASFTERRVEREPKSTC